jgi:hypothetical protein
MSVQFKLANIQRKRQNFTLQKLNIYFYMVFFRLKYFLHIINQVNKRIRVRDMLVYATFNNISVISVEETGVPGEKHRHAASH